VNERSLPFEHPIYETLLSVPGLSVMAAPLDLLLEWGLRNSLWVFPMATSCCGIELMAAAASRVDLDRMGTIVRATPRQADVMVVAGTITVKMAPRVKTLWDQMPEPKWCIAMGSCAISGDFYRNLYSVVPGIDNVLPVDVYIPGCPPNPEALMHGLLRLQEKVKMRRQGLVLPREPKPEEIAREEAQVASALAATALDDSDEREPPAIAPIPDALYTNGHSDIESILRDAGATELPKDAAPIVDTAKHVALAQRLRALGYRQLVYVAASHFPAKTGAKPTPERFEIAYALRAIGRESRVAAWRLALNAGEAAPSLARVFAGADWQEREQFDLFGVRFDGHPDMRRILLPANWEGHPLRKDYPADKACPPWR